MEIVKTIGKIILFIIIWITLIIPRLVIIILRFIESILRIIRETLIHLTKIIEKEALGKKM